MNTLITLIFLALTIHLVINNRTKDKTMIEFGNITGSGLPIEYVKKNANLFPLSGLKKSKKVRKEFIYNLSIKE